MTEKYYHTKKVDPEVLDEAMKLRTTFRNVYVGGHVKVNNDGTIDDDNIELEFSRALNSPEQDQIVDIINAMGPAYDLVIRKGIEKNTMKCAMEQGHAVLRQFAANNIYRGKTSDQISGLVNDYPQIVNSLITGSLQTAYFIFTTMSPDANISEEEIDEFSLRLKIILGIE